MVDNVVGTEESPREQAFGARIKIGIVTRGLRVGELWDDSCLCPLECFRGHAIFREGRKVSEQQTTYRERKIYPEKKRAKSCHETFSRRPRVGATNALYWKAIVNLSSPAYTKAWENVNFTGTPLRQKHHDRMYHKCEAR